MAPATVSDWKCTNGPGSRPSGPSCPAEPLQPGMVFTLEPGAYFPAGAACESKTTSCADARGAEWLTDVPRFWTMSDG